MGRDPHRIVLHNLSQKDKEKASADLAKFIKNSSPETRVHITNDDKTAMDFGATLVLVLGTGAAVAVADGIKAWMTRWHGVSITIETPEGKIIAENISSNDIHKLESLLTKL